MRYVYPDPKNDRTWTRAEWKRIDRTCRVLNRTMAPKVEEALSRAFTNYILWGIRPEGKTMNNYESGNMPPVPAYMRDTMCKCTECGATWIGTPRALCSECAALAEANRGPSEP